MPEPATDRRATIRLPDALLRQATRLARERDLSLQKFLLAAIREKIERDEKGVTS